MIRPRTGDFLYTSAEINVMINDIQTFRELGAEGVVFGVLKPDGWVDVERTTRLALEAETMQGQSRPPLFTEGFQRLNEVCSMLPSRIRHDARFNRGCRRKAAVAPVGTNPEHNPRPHEVRSLLATTSRVDSSSPKSVSPADAVNL